ncbi:MAG: hemolysin family protein [Chloroflexota bacterium]
MASTQALIWLAVLGLLELALSAGRSALVNSRQDLLAEWQESGQPGSALALRVASNATPLMTSLRVGQGLLRLGVLALGGLVALTSSWGARQTVGAVGGGVVIVGLLLGVLESGCENLVLRSAEKWGVLLAPLVAGAVWVFSPLGWLQRRWSTWAAGQAARQAHPVVTEEAIMTLVDAGEEGGVIEEEEKAMIYSIFQLGDTLAREVMVPRIDILAFDESTTLKQAADALLRAGHSRAPVYSGSIDNIIGLLYAKDLLAAWREGKHEGMVRDLLRPAYFVPEAKKADDLLAEMQSNRVHMAVVVDEYGGTAGVVTIEDIVEEILGEIQDEYDVAEELPYNRLSDGSYLFKGQIPIDDVNELMEVELPKDVSDTLGGLVFNRLGRVPAAGEAVEVDGLRLTVEQVAGRRIRKVRASRIQPGAAPESDKDETNASAER